MKTVQLILPSTAEGEAWRTLEVSTSAARGPLRILLAPGALVMAREVSSLGRTDAQARAATLAVLSAEMATPTDACVCALERLAGEPRMAYVMERRAIDHLVDAAKLLGYAPDAIMPDFAVLPASQQGAVLVAKRGDCLVRTGAAVFACQPDLLPTLIGANAVQEVDFEAAARAWIGSGRHASCGNLLVGAAPSPDRRRVSVLAGIAAGAALLIFAGLPWFEANQLDASTARLRAQTEQVARTALPSAHRIVNPIAQLREASQPREQAAAGLEHAITVVEGLARSPGVAVARLSYDGEAVRAHVGVSSTSLLQPLRDHLAASGLSMVETPGLSDPNSIPVELTVTAAP